MAETPQIFLHSCNLDRATKERLKKAGVITVKVDDFSQVKLMDASSLPVTGGELLWCAMDALKSNYSSSEAQRFTNNFCKILAERTGRGDTHGQ